MTKQLSAPSHAPPGSGVVLRGFGFRGQGRGGLQSVPGSLCPQKSGTLNCSLRGRLLDHALVQHQGLGFWMLGLRVWGLL